MLTLLRRISLPELRKHLLRNALTLMGIVLGVAIFSAVQSANSSLTSSLRDTIDQIAGKAVLQATAGQAGMPESAVEVIRAVPGVRAAAPVIEAVVRTGDAGQGNILILGVDLAGDRTLRDYRLEGAEEEAVSDPLVFLAQPDSLMVSKEFADRNGLKAESTIDLITAVGKKKFTIRGIMQPRGMAKAFGGNIGVMDIYSAQYVFNRGMTFDRIDIALEDGIGIDDVLPGLQAALGPGYKVEPPLRRGKQVESLLAAYTSALYFSSVIALTIGLFLIFNVFSVNITQRRAQIGVLRALGVTRARIQRMFLVESLLLGIAGSLIGIAAGILMGRGVMLSMAAVIRDTYGVQFQTDRLQIDPFWMILSFAAGVFASWLGAYLPARAAARIEPALALQKGKYQVLYLGENRLRRLAGIFLLAACLALGFTPWARAFSIQLVLYIVLFVSLALLVPTFSHLLASVLRRPMGLLFGVEGKLASDSLVQAPRRTSATVSALMFSLTFVLIVATFSASLQVSLTQWIESSINPDLFVYASESISVRNFQFPASVGNELRAVPGVRQVDAVRLLNIDYNGKSPLLASIEMDQFLSRSTPVLEEGKMADLLPSMAGKNGILISNNFSRIYGLHRGDALFLDTPTGRHEFRIAGVSLDYSSDNGSLMIDRDTYTRLWKDDRVDVFDLMIEKGYDPAAVKAEIQRRLSGSRNILIMTNQDMRSELTRLIDQYFAFQYVQLLVAVLVAVLGIVNSLTVSITERKREIGILRGLGGERFRVRKAILLEAVCIGLVASVLGIISGGIMGYYSATSFGASINGWVFPYRFPYDIALLLIPGVVLLALASAWYPSSLALRTPIVEALAYE